MKSPFPGMDPYVEAGGLWEDFHDDLIAEIKRVLARAVPKGFVVRTRSRSYVVLAEAEEKSQRPFVPDVSVTPARGGGPAVASPPADVEPVSMRAFVEAEYEEKFIDVYELKPERRLVTSVEVLSPFNKRRRSLGWRKYLRKRQALLLGKANLVEIDLLRGGERMPMLDPGPASPYAVLVARDTEAPHCRVWPAFADRPLPTVPVPLSPPHPDVPLALQPLVDAIYERGRYDEEIDYRQPPDPPLGPGEAAWLEQRLRGAAPPRPRRGKRR